MLQQLNVVGDSIGLMHIHICVKEKSGYFEHKLRHFHSSVTK